MEPKPIFERLSWLAVLVVAVAKLVVALVVVGRVVTLAEEVAALVVKLGAKGVEDVSAVGLSLFDSATTGGTPGPSKTSRLFKYSGRALITI
jgi:hypothetical protein